uniref:Mitochondrial import receptor subunit TOM7 homolog n=1 Tax=Calidris pygmaea TaxID=425635 RepID=A0A8C3JCZ5_9CHAR
MPGGRGGAPGSPRPPFSCPSQGRTASHRRVPSPRPGGGTMEPRPPPLAQGYEGGWAPPPPPPLPPPLCPAAGMPKLSKEAKQRLQQLFKGGQFAIRWGFIPVVLYLGFKRGADPGMPEPTIWRYVLVPNVCSNPIQIVTILGVCLDSSSCEGCFHPLVLIVWGESIVGCGSYFFRNPKEMTAKHKFLGGPFSESCMASNGWDFLYLLSESCPSDLL